MRNARVNVRYSWLAFAKRDILATCRTGRLILVSLGITASFLISTLPGFSIAQQNTRVNLPADIRNAIVRVAGDGLGPGSGTVIRVKPGNNGWWLCVLTADHVVSNRANWWIGFGNGGPPVGEHAAAIRIRGALNNDGTRVDLAMLGVFIRDANGDGQLDEIPNIPRSITIGAPPNDNLVAAGYGYQGRRGQRNGNNGYFIVRR